MSSNELKPCPRCGGRNLIHAPVASTLPKRPRWTVSCEDCGQCGGVAPTVARAEESWDKRSGSWSIEKWIRRPQESKEDKP